MVEKEVVVNENTYKLKELSYLSMVSSNTSGDRAEFFKKMLKDSIVSPEPTDEFISKIPFREGNDLMKEINKLNGIGEEGEEDFQEPSNNVKTK